MSLPATASRKGAGVQCSRRNAAPPGPRAAPRVLAISLLVSPDLDGRQSQLRHPCVRLPTAHVAEAPPPPAAFAVWPRAAASPPSDARSLSKSGKLTYPGSLLRPACGHAALPLLLQLLLTSLVSLASPVRALRALLTLTSSAGRRRARGALVREAKTASTAVAGEGWPASVGRRGWCWCEGALEVGLVGEEFVRMTQGAEGVAAVMRRREVVIVGVVVVVVFLGRRDAREEDARRRDEGDGLIYVVSVRINVPLPLSSAVQVTRYSGMRGKR